MRRAGSGGCAQTGCTAYPPAALNEEAQRQHARLRIDADRGLAAEIAGITGSGKGVVIYGSGHGEHADDLDNFLPGSTRILVAMRADGIDQLRPGQDSLMDRSRLPDPRQAEGVYLVEPGRYVRNDDASLAAACRLPGVDAGKLGLCQLGAPGAPDTAPETAPAAPSGPPPTRLRQSSPGGM